MKKQEQAHNKSNNLKITYKGETKTVSEWSRITGITRFALTRRLKKGWDIDKIFNYKKENKENKGKRRLHRREMLIVK